MGVSITEKAGKIKGKVTEAAFRARSTLQGVENGLTKDLFVVLLFVISALISFGLGRISAVEKPTAGALYIPSETKQEGVIASKTGTKYISRGVQARFQYAKIINSILRAL